MEWKKVPVPDVAMTIPNPRFNLIANNLQTIYMQTAPQAYQGALLLHASHTRQELDFDYDHDELEAMLDRELPRLTYVRNGRLACYAKLDGSRPIRTEAEYALLYTKHFELQWRGGLHAWRFRNVRRLDTYVVTEDRPGLWELPEQLRREVWQKNPGLFLADEAWSEGKEV